MRNRTACLLPLLPYLGALFWIFGFVLLVPLLILLIPPANAPGPDVSGWCYVLPAATAWALGWALKGRRRLAPLDARQSMLICALGWILISGLGALPLWLGLRVSYLDAYFEAVSGLTTTGITMLTGLDSMARSAIFWRALLQWLGGLGILAFFLVIMFTGGAANQLFSAESHKIFSKRPVPGLFNTLKILWLIYAAFTLLITLLLVCFGASLFDAVCHAFTALSTGGYSPYDASIDAYRQAGHPHYRAIEYILAFGMLLGGMNFLVHYRVLTGRVKTLWGTFEMRLFWGILGGCTALVVADHWRRFGVHDVEATVRYSLFQVVSVMTTTGFGTKDIGAAFFPALSRQIFLLLMVVGGCVGSTGGGIKVLRIGVLFKMLSRQMRRVIYGPSAVNLILVDGEKVDVEEVRRVAALFFAWMILLLAGGGITAWLSHLGPMESASGMFSALGNIGPCYISVTDMTQLHAAVKITYIIGMLAGRLEILPILLLITPRAWR